MGETIFGSVVNLIRYPVSSLAGEELERATLGLSGIAGDRLFGFFEQDTGHQIYPARDGRWNAAPQIHARLRDELELSTDGQSWLPADDPEITSRIDAVFGQAVELHAYGPRLCRREADGGGRCDRRRLGREEPAPDGPAQRLRLSHRGHRKQSPKGRAGFAVERRAFCRESMHCGTFCQPAAAILRP